MNNRSLGSGTGLLLGFLLCFAGNSSHAQNLVPNPDFEDTDSCTFGLGLGELQHWYSAYLTPDHLQSCLPYGSANGLPVNQFTYQQPFEGSSCAGIHTYDGDTGQEWREWLMVPLLDTMVPGVTYYCSFQANAGFGGNVTNPNIWLASSHLGMLFTTYDRQWTWGDPYPAALNQAHILHPQILSDTVGWTLVSGSFVADSAYQYLMLGNFFSNVLTDTLHFAPPGPTWNAYSYTLVDAVCVSPNPGGCDLAQGLGEDLSNGPVLFPNPAQNELVVSKRAGAEAQVLDAMGRLLWQGRIPGDRWVLDVASWARGAYVLRMAHRGQVESHTFILTDR